MNSASERCPAWLCDSAIQMMAPMALAAKNCVMGADAELADDTLVLVERSAFAAFTARLRS